MYKKIFFPLVISSLFFVGCIELVDTPKTFDKSNILDSNVTLEKIQQIKNKPQKNQVIERRYVNFPPIIPHSVRDISPINKNQNSCLDCHTQKNEKLKSHFIQNEIQSNYYNCLSCHTQSN